MNPLPIAQLEIAINRARAAEPSTGAESALSRDVAVLARLYGALIHRRCDTLDLDALTDEEQLTLLRWLAT